MEHSYSPFALLLFQFKKRPPSTSFFFVLLIFLALFQIISIYSWGHSFFLPSFTSSLVVGPALNTPSLLHHEHESSTGRSSVGRGGENVTAVNEEEEKVILLVHDEPYQNTSYNNVRSTEITTRTMANITADEAEPAGGYHKNGDEASIATDAANKSKDGDNKQKSCLLALNSKDWLNKPRYGNEPSNFSHKLLSSTVLGFSQEGHLLDHLEDLLGHQNICHEKSLFQSLENSDVATKNETLLIRMWKIRLIYAAFYYHQHEHAIEEARDRIRFDSSSSSLTQNDDGHCNCRDDMEKYKVGSFDYECRNAKLIVADIQSRGIGSLIKRDLFNIFMAGIALNRTVVLYNSLGKEGVGSAPWKLSSCPRRDYQCTFRPLSGCAPLIEEIYNATVVNHKDIGNYLNQFHNPLIAANNSIAAPPPEEDTRVIYYANPFSILRISPKFLMQLNRIAHSIIDELDPGDGRIPVLRKAAEAILSDSDVKHFGKFDHENSDSMIAFILYFLRPREDKARLLEEFMAKDLPEDFDSTRTLGLPFRGSDKCNQESECLTFPTYMKLLKSRWLEEEGFHQGHSNETNVTANIIVTSEVPNIMELARDFSTDELYQNKMPFHINWITNTNDVHQGNGAAHRPKLTGGATADDVMLSILSSFKVQMNAAATIGNCCSNFHQIIFHLLKGGCGLHIDNTGQCLQYRKESIYQLCCDVRSRRSCVKRRLARLRKEYNDENITVSGVEAKLWEE